MHDWHGSALPAQFALCARITAEVAALNGTDADLLALLAEVDRLARERDTLQVSVADLRPDDWRHAAAWAQIMALEAQWREATVKAATVPAHTTAGVRAKARVVRTEMGADLETEPRSGADALLWSLLDDLLGGHWR